LDGEIRVLDIMHPYLMFNFPAGNGLKSITCMQVFWETVVCGSNSGEVLIFQLPDVEALSKANSI
jgi:hypothetical protein